MADEDKKIFELDLSSPLSGSEMYPISLSGGGNYRVTHNILKAWLDGFYSNQSTVTNHITNVNVHFPDAPVDGVGYVRKDGAWVEEAATTARVIDIGATYAISGDIVVGATLPFFIPVAPNDSVTLTEANYTLLSAAGNTATFTVRLSGGSVTGLTGLVADDTNKVSLATSPPGVANRQFGDFTVTGISGTPNGLSVTLVTRHSLT